MTTSRSRKVPRFKTGDTVVTRGTTWPVMVVELREIVLLGHPDALVRWVSADGRAQKMETSLDALEPAPSEVRKEESAMKKNIVMSLEPSKETKGCYRYAHTSGDKGVTTLYLRKDDVDGPAPETITVAIRG